MAKKKDNGHEESIDIAQLLQMTLAQNREIMERLEELEKGKDNYGKALLQMVNRIYDTPDKNMPELTNIPLRAARPHALGMALEDLMNPEVLNGEIPFSRLVRMNYFRLMRSVGGTHLGRATRIAEEQIATQAEKAMEEQDFGINE